MKTVGTPRVRNYTDWTDRELQAGIKRCDEAIERARSNVTLSEPVRRRRIAPQLEHRNRYRAELAKRGVRE